MGVIDNKIALWVLVTTLNDSYLDDLIRENVVCVDRIAMT